MWSLLLDAIDLSYSDRCVCQIKDMEIKRLTKNIVFNRFLDNIVKIAYIVAVFTISFVKLNILTKFILMVLLSLGLYVFLLYRWKNEDIKYHQLDCIKSQMFSRAFKKVVVK